jgi:hypothetical protein
VRNTETNLRFSNVPEDGSKIQSLLSVGQLIHQQLSRCIAIVDENIMYFLGMLKEA